VLWREAYRTQVARDVSLPPLGVAREGRYVLLGGFDLRAYRQMQIWLRLLQADSPETSVLLVFFKSPWSAKELGDLEAMIPPSLSDLTHTVVDGEGQWHSLIAPDSPERAFAAIVEDDRSDFMIKGVPTEEGWDAFLEALRERT